MHTDRWEGAIMGEHKQQIHWVDPEGPPHVSSRKRHSIFGTDELKDMAKGFTSEQLREFKGAFKLFDKDNDGMITMKELVTVLRSLGQDPNSEDIVPMMQSLDCDGSGAIDFQEFLQLMAKIISETEQEEDYIEVFRVLDQDGDGAISKGDLREVVHRLKSDLTHEEVDEMFGEADKDGDGQINYEEFLKIIMSRS